MMNKTTLLLSSVALFAFTSCLNDEQRGSINALKQVTEQAGAMTEAAEETKDNGSFTLQLNGKDHPGSDVSALLVGVEGSGSLTLSATTEPGNVSFQCYFNTDGLKPGDYKFTSTAGAFSGESAGMEEAGYIAMGSFDDRPADTGGLTISEIDLDGNPNTMSGSYAFSVQEDNGEVVEVSGDFSGIGITKMMGLGAE